MLTPDLAISGIVSVSIITNVIYKSADFKNYAPSFKNTIVINRMNCCVCIRQHEVLFSPVPEERSEKTYLDTARGGDNLARGVGMKIY
jgi:hypothetical protein